MLIGVVLKVSIQHLKGSNSFSIRWRLLLVLNLEWRWIQMLPWICRVPTFELLYNTQQFTKAALDTSIGHPCTPTKQYFYCTYYRRKRLFWKTDKKSQKLLILLITEHWMMSILVASFSGCLQGLYSSNVNKYGKRCLINEI